MSILTNSELIKFLVCPNCGNKLAETKYCLECEICKEEYEVKNGIPILFAPNIEPNHLEQEKKLADMMKREIVTKKDEFSSIQWALSKREFWKMVNDKIGSVPKSIINIGCGYDRSFKQFQEKGYTFINFDIVYDMLYALQSEHKAISCVAGDINKLPFKKRYFDYIVCIDVIHHDSNRIFDILKSFRNLLKSGGSLFLEDPNAWGIFQMAKSIILPKPIYKYLREMYHQIKRSNHRPASYEFPTNVWKVKSILKKLEFENISIYSNTAYPNITKKRYCIYKALSNFRFIAKYHNYHYMLTAIKK
jgi:SAM-dependent methyltransferase